MSDLLNFTVSETARGKRGLYTITLDPRGFRLWLNGHLQGQFDTAERAREMANAMEVIDEHGAFEVPVKINYGDV